MTSRSPESIESSAGDVQPWVPQHHLRSIDAHELKLSRGFLRSSPSRWFPGLATHWLPLFHATGMEFQVSEVSPLARLDDAVEPLGAWTVDDESVVLYSDALSRSTLVEAIVPASGRCARQVALEYLCRRIAVSLQSSWSGKEGALVNYDSEFQAETFKPHGWIRVRGSLNQTRVMFAFGLSRGVVEKMDGLWRRQLAPSRGAAVAQKAASSSVRIELVRLSVSPQGLSSYLRAGSLIDLEIGVSPNVVLRSGEDAWLGAALNLCNDMFALESLAVVPPALQVAEGATPLSVEFGSVQFDGAALAEFEQAGAIVETPLAASDRVALTIRGEKVASARLVTFEGRFAISVL